MSKTNQTLRDVLKGTYDCGYELGVASSDGYYPPDKKYVKEELDQALKEISELLVECKPEKLGTVGTWSDTGQKVLAGSSEDIAYNKALDDYEKNIKDLL